MLLIRNDGPVMQIATNVAIDSFGYEPLCYDISNILRLWNYLGSQYVPITPLLFSCCCITSDP